LRSDLSAKIDASSKDRDDISRMDQEIRNLKDEVSNLMAANDDLQWANQSLLQKLDDANAKHHTQSTDQQQQIADL
jgi:regulator of replication initiation timing